MTFQFIRIPEHHESSDNPPSLTQYWRASGEPAAATVKAFAQSGTPITVATINGTLFRDDIQLKQTAYNQYDVAVIYSSRNLQQALGLQVGEWTWDFDTTGGSVHITWAKEEVGRYKSGANPGGPLVAGVPDQKGQIGVDGNNVNGVDIVIPLMKINVQFRHPPGYMTLGKARYLSSVTGTVNSDTFLTYSPGEILFMGSRGGNGSATESTVSYSFLASPNATLTVGDIQNIARKGHEVLWIAYQDESVFSGNTPGGNPEMVPVRVPKYAYVDRVYDPIPMAAAFGFGG
jgi:hypothetical protein